MRQGCWDIATDRIWHGANIWNDLLYQIGQLRIKREFRQQYDQIEKRNSSTLSYKPHSSREVKPTLLFTFNCINEDVVISGGAAGFQGSIKINKSQFAVLIVLIDVVSTLTLIAMFKLLEKQQEKFVE